MANFPQKMRVHEIPALIDDNLPPEMPVLIAGPTASGKSSLALEIATQAGGEIVNADALQVYSCWNVLSARPSPDDLKQAAHHLYGHVEFDQSYSVGTWLKEVSNILKTGKRPIITGGTGLYFRALTEGLADIPHVNASVRREVQGILTDEGLSKAIELLAPEDKDMIDLRNPVRVARALEVYLQTKQSLASWHHDTPTPILPLNKTFPLVFETDVEWLNSRISQRFELMMKQGAVKEVESILPFWNDTLPALQAIGAREIKDYLRGGVSLQVATELAILATKQYAKRQRTWFRNRMKTWYKVSS